MRLRIGIALWLASWIPLAMILGLQGTAVPIMWTVQVVVGIIGVAIAGAAFAAMAKTAGWKRAVPMAVTAAWTGRVPAADPLLPEPPATGSAPSDPSA